MKKTKTAAKAPETPASAKAIDSMLDSMTGRSGGFTIGSMLGGVSQVTSAVMIRSQLERIADAQELMALYTFLRDDASDETCEGRDAVKKAIPAVARLRDRIIERVEREAAAREPK